MRTAYHNCCIAIIENYKELKGTEYNIDKYFKHPSIDKYYRHPLNELFNLFCKLPTDCVNLLEDIYKLLAKHPYLLIDEEKGYTFTMVSTLFETVAHECFYKKGDTRYLFLFDEVTLTLSQPKLRQQNIPSFSSLLENCEQVPHKTVGSNLSLFRFYSLCENIIERYKLIRRKEYGWKDKLNNKNRNRIHGLLDRFLLKFEEAELNEESLQEITVEIKQYYERHSTKKELRLRIALFTLLSLANAEQATLEKHDKLPDKLNRSSLEIREAKGKEKKYSDDEAETVQPTVPITNRTEENDQGSSSGFSINDELNQIKSYLEQAVIEHDDLGKYVYIKFNDKEIVQLFTNLLLHLGIENTSEPGRSRKIIVNESADEFIITLESEEFKRTQAHLNNMTRIAEHSHETEQGDVPSLTAKEWLQTLQALDEQLLTAIPEDEKLLKKLHTPQQSHENKLDALIKDPPYESNHEAGKRVINRTSAKHQFESIKIGIKKAFSRRSNEAHHQRNQPAVKIEPETENKSLAWIMYRLHEILQNSIEEHRAYASITSANKLCLYHQDLVNQVNGLLQEFPESSKHPILATLLKRMIELQIQINAQVQLHHHQEKLFAHAIERKLVNYWQAASILGSGLVAEKPGLKERMLQLLNSFALAAPAAEGVIGTLANVPYFIGPIFNGVTPTAEAVHLIDFVNHLPGPHEGVHSLSKKVNHLAEGMVKKTAGVEILSEEDLRYHIVHSFSNSKACQKESKELGMHLAHAYEDLLRTLSTDDTLKLADWVTKTLLKYMSVGAYRHDGDGQVLLSELDEATRRQLRYDRSLGWIFYQAWSEQPSDKIIFRNQTHELWEFFAKPGLYALVDEQTGQRVCFDVSTILKQYSWYLAPRTCQVKTESNLWGHRAASSIEIASYREALHVTVLQARPRPQARHEGSSMTFGKYTDTAGITFYDNGVYAQQCYQAYFRKRGELGGGDESARNTSLQPIDSKEEDASAGIADAWEPWYWNGEEFWDEEDFRYKKEFWDEEELQKCLGQLRPSRHHLVGSGIQGVSVDKSEVDNLKAEMIQQKSEHRREVYMLKEEMEQQKRDFEKRIENMEKSSNEQRKKLKCKIKALMERIENLEAGNGQRQQPSLQVLPIASTAQPRPTFTHSASVSNAPSLAQAVGSSMAREGILNAVQLPITDNNTARLDTMRENTAADSTTKIDYTG